MKTTDLRNSVEKVLGNNIRCLLPSYWWKRLFHQVADTIDEVNGVDIVRSEGALNRLDAPIGSLASIANKKTMKFSECYVPTDEDDNLTDEELYAKLTPVTGLEMTFPLPDISAADTSIQLVAEGGKGLGFLMISEGFCAAVFVLVGEGTQKYWILSGQMMIDGLNKFLSQQRWYFLDDPEEVGAENMTLFDQIFTIVDCTSDVYVKGLAWEKLAKEGESGSASVPSYTLYYTTYKVNGVTTMADKYINLNKEEYAKITASQKAKENYLLQVVELGSTEEYAPVDVELSWLSVADLSDTDSNLNVIVCSFLQKDGANQPQRRLVSFKSDGTAEYELIPTGDVKFLYYADGVNSLSAKEKAHNASAILSIKNSFDSSFTPSPIIIRYKINSTKYLSLQGILSGNDAEGDGVSLTAFASQNVYYRFNYDLATGEPAKAEVIKTVDSELSDTSENPVQNKVVTAELAKKQDSLVSGTNIKTINGTSLLGSGDITIQGGSGNDVTVDSILSTTSTNPVQNKAITVAINAKADKSDIKTLNGVSLLGGGNLQLGDGQTIVYDDTEVWTTIDDIYENIDYFYDEMGIIGDVFDEYDEKIYEASAEASSVAYELKVTEGYSLKGSTEFKDFLDQTYPYHYSHYVITDVESGNGTDDWEIILRADSMDHTEYSIKKTDLPYSLPASSFEIIGSYYTTNVKEFKVYHPLIYENKKLKELTTSLESRITALESQNA